jgi:hypothetical protein
VNGPERLIFVNGMTNREAHGGRRLGWLVVGVLSVVTAGWGLLDPGIYLGLIAPATRPSALSQDVVAVVVGIILCGLALTNTRVGPRAELVALGLLGCLFYSYGTYAIERVYNVLYLNYLAIFGLAVWLLVLGAVDIVLRTAHGGTLPRPLRRISAGGALLQPLIIYPLWIGMLIPSWSTTTRSTPYIRSSSSTWFSSCRRFYWSASGYSATAVGP